MTRMPVIDISVQDCGLFGGAKPWDQVSLVTSQVESIIGITDKKLDSKKLGTDTGRVTEHSTYGDVVKQVNSRSPVLLTTSAPDGKFHGCLCHNGEIVLWQSRESSKSTSSTDAAVVLQIPADTQLFQDHDRLDPSPLYMAISSCGCYLALLIHSKHQQQQLLLVAIITTWHKSDEGCSWYTIPLHSMGEEYKLEDCELCTAALEWVHEKRHGKLQLQYSAVHLESVVESDIGREKHRLVTSVVPMVALSGDTLEDSGHADQLGLSQSLSMPVTLPAGIQQAFNETGTLDMLASSQLSGRSVPDVKSCRTHSVVLFDCLKKHPSSCSDALSTVMGAVVPSANGSRQARSSSAFVMSLCPWNSSALALACNQDTLDSTSLVVVIGATTHQAITIPYAQAVRTVCDSGDVTSDVTMFDPVSWWHITALSWIASGSLLAALMKSGTLLIFTRAGDLAWMQICDKLVPALTLQPLFAVKTGHSSDADNPNKDALRVVSGTSHSLQWYGSRQQLLVSNGRSYHVLALRPKHLHRCIARQRQQLLDVFINIVQSKETVEWEKLFSPTFKEEPLDVSDSTASSLTSLEVISSSHTGGLDTDRLKDMLELNDPQTLSSLGSGGQLVIWEVATLEHFATCMSRVEASGNCPQCFAFSASFITIVEQLLSGKLASVRRLGLLLKAVTGLCGACLRWISRVTGADADGSSTSACCVDTLLNSMCHVSIICAGLTALTRADSMLSHQGSATRQHWNATLSNILLQLITAQCSVLRQRRLTSAANPLPILLLLGYCCLQASASREQHFDPDRHCMYHSVYPPSSLLLVSPCSVQLEHLHDAARLLCRSAHDNSESPEPASTLQPTIASCQDMLQSTLEEIIDRARSSCVDKASDAADGPTTEEYYQAVKWILGRLDTGLVATDVNLGVVNVHPKPSADRSQTPQEPGDVTKVPEGSLFKSFLYLLHQLDLRKLHGAFTHSWTYPIQLSVIKESICLPVGWPVDLERQRIVLNFGRFMACYFTGWPILIPPQNEDADLHDLVRVRCEEWGDVRQRYRLLPHGDVTEALQSAGLSEVWQASHALRWLCAAGGMEEAAAFAMHLSHWRIAVVLSATALECNTSNTVPGMLPPACLLSSTILSLLPLQSLLHAVQAVTLHMQPAADKALIQRVRSTATVSTAQRHKHPGQQQKQPPSFTLSDLMVAVLQNSADSSSAGTKALPAVADVCGALYASSRHDIIEQALALLLQCAFGLLSLFIIPISESFYLPAPPVYLPSPPTGSGSSSEGSEAASESNLRALLHQCVSLFCVLMAATGHKSILMEHVYSTTGCARQSGRNVKPDTGNLKDGDAAERTEEPHAFSQHQRWLLRALLIHCRLLWWVNCRDQLSTTWRAFCAERTSTVTENQNAEDTASECLKWCENLLPAMPLLKPDAREELLQITITLINTLPLTVSTAKLLATHLSPLKPQLWSPEVLPRLQQLLQRLQFTQVSSDEAQTDQASTTSLGDMFYTFSVDEQTPPHTASDLVGDCASLPDTSNCSLLDILSMEHAVPPLLGISDDARIGDRSESYDEFLSLVLPVVEEKYPAVAPPSAAAERRNSPELLKIVDALSSVCQLPQGTQEHAASVFEALSPMLSWFWAGSLTGDGDRQASTAAVGSVAHLSLGLSEQTVAVGVVAACAQSRCVDHIPSPAMPDTVDEPGYRLEDMAIVAHSGKAMGHDGEETRSGASPALTADLDTLTDADAEGLFKAALCHLDSEQTSVSMLTSALGELDISVSSLHVPVVFGLEPVLP
eukprot:scpid8895/ scgid6137/ 